MKRTLILGGGFGGLAVAHTLRRLRPEDEIMLVDQTTHFMVGFRKTWKLLGMFDDEAGQRPLSDLAQFGIEVVNGWVSAIDPPARAVEVDGRRLEADVVVVALGARLATELVPGFDDYVLNLYDSQALSSTRQALQAFTGGRVGIGVFGLPYKCPPAPYEIALLTKDFFRKRGVDVELEVFTPQPMSLPILGDAGCNVIEGRLAENDITFLPKHKATAVAAGEVVFDNGHTKAYDLLLGVPPHRCPAVVVDSGLADSGGWVKVNPRTLETAFEGVHAIGDVVEILMANGQPLPKAGVFAEAEGQVAAQRIAATFAGQEPDAAFDGQGGCFLEVGDGVAMMVEGEFLAEPRPQVRLTPADASYFEQKRGFEVERLNRWFADVA